VAIIGASIANTLFRNRDPVGKIIKIRGMKFQVIGLMKEEGQSFLGFVSSDENCLIPYGLFRKMYYTGSKAGIGSTIAIKGLESDQGLSILENEVKGLMRRVRGLRPTQEDNFALNRPEAIANVIGESFKVIGLAGWIIGSFAILVGGFGIANIMFVSVKERTNIIGIQKSLGAKNYFILYQFLFESIFLSLFGGCAGLLLVFAFSFIQLGTLELSLTINNIILGLGVSVLVGICSGIIPAIIASRLDPVIAIRTN